MELALSVVAILLAVVALGLVLGLQKQIAQIPPPRAETSADLEGLRRETIDLRRDLDRAQRELEELKAATEILPAPPLPRARSAGLTDLREQLRAAHLDPESGSEE
jgi:septation ring formation regulator EzrA